ncbi:MAG: HAD family hydrolase [Candidatus Dojkabacteria bacterium]|nr:HAD family hydrolase [Candidatus Dojkabacteria bacterium]MDQ7020851.1 HAD family hydrolase [Candidatus Dojkabacteria bacterium]
MIKAICFDLDGVYFTEAGKKGYERRLLELSPKSPEEVREFIYNSKATRDHHLGLLSIDEYLNEMNEALEVNLDFGVFKEIYTDYYEVNPEIKEVILDLKVRGYIICACSNISESRIKALQEKFGFFSDFDALVFSFKERVFKPDQKIFEALVREAGCLPEELVYADDN